jgi:integrase/recombinase XerC
VGGPGEVAGSAALTLVTEATPLSPGPALFEAMLEGWRRQQAARRLTGALIDGRERVIRRFGTFTGGLPWQWTPGQVETWIAEGGMGALDHPLLSGNGGAVPGVCV